MKKRFTVSEPAKVADLQRLRVSILNTLLFSASAIGTALYIFALIPAFQEGLTFTTAIYTVIFIWLLLIAFIQRLPYGVRVGSMLFLLYALGILNLTESGLNVDAGLFLLTFISMTALLIGLRGGLYALGLTGSTVVVLGIIVVTGNINLSLRLPQENPMLWVIGGIILILTGTILTITLTTLLRGLESNLLKATALSTELEQEQVVLRKQTQSLEYRSTQIQAAAEISRAISVVLNPQELLQQVVNLIQERFNLYFAGVFLLDEHRELAVLQAGTGEAGRKMIASGYKFAISDSSIIGWAIAHRKIRIAHNIGEDTAFFANPHLPLARTELVLPLISADRVLGALTVQSEHEAAFDEDSSAVFQGISDTLSIALENDNLFIAQETNLKEIRALQRQYLLEAWSERGRMEHEAEFTFGTVKPEEKLVVIDVPMTLREQTIGQLRLEGNRDWTPEERTLIEAIAAQAALAMENARLLEESQQLALHERLVADITSKVWSSANANTILQTTIKELSRALSADDATIELKMD